MHILNSLNAHSLLGNREWNGSPSVYKHTELYSGLNFTNQAKQPSNTPSLQPLARAHILALPVSQFVLNTLSAKEKMS